MFGPNHIGDHEKYERELKARNAHNFKYSDEVKLSLEDLLFRREDMAKYLTHSHEFRAISDEIILKSIYLVNDMIKDLLGI